MMTNGMDPGQMTPIERLDEVSMLLSLAMTRLWVKRRVGTGRQRVFSNSSSFSRKFSQVGEDCLELSARTSPDETVDLRRELSEWKIWNRRS